VSWQRIAKSLNSWNNGHVLRTMSQCKQKLKDLRKKYPRHLFSNLSPKSHPLARCPLECRLIQEIVSLYSIERKPNKRVMIRSPDADPVKMETEADSKDEKNDDGVFVASEDTSSWYKLTNTLTEMKHSSSWRHIQSQDRPSKLGSSSQ
jgi:hypothetical protein